MTWAQGQVGEKQAADYLIAQGYQILEKNWRFLRAEIDLIAKHGNEVVFVEVKWRQNNDFGFPEEYVSRAKIGHLRRAIEGYLAKHPAVQDIRVDIVAITGEPFALEHLVNIDLS